MVSLAAASFESPLDGVNVLATFAPSGAFTALRKRQNPKDKMTPAPIQKTKIRIAIFEALQFAQGTVTTTNGKSAITKLAKLMGPTQQRNAVSASLQTMEEEGWVMREKASPNPRVVTGIMLVEMPAVFNDAVAALAAKKRRGKPVEPVGREILHDGTFRPPVPSPISAVKDPRDTEIEALKAQLEAAQLQLVSYRTLLAAELTQ